MGGLGDIGSVQTVVVGHVGAVVILKLRQVGDEDQGGDTELSHQVPLLPSRVQQYNVLSALETV